MLDRGLVHVFVAGGVLAKLASPANDASGFTDKIACQEQSRRANSAGDDKQSAAHDDSCFPLISIFAAFAIEMGSAELLFLFGRGRSGGAFADDF